MPVGGFLAVDSDSDGVGFVGVRVARRDDGHLQARSEFRVESLHAMWDAVHELLEDKAIALGLTPGLAGLCPLDLQRRMHIWGQQEMTKYTAIVRGLILEGHLLHEGQMSLEEHVNRAVSGRAAGNAITITSAKSPGPIEQCRCMIAAAGHTAISKVGSVGERRSRSRERLAGSDSAFAALLNIGRALVHRGIPGTGGPRASKFPLGHRGDLCLF
jgi:hypothetical protein